ncbi:MAG: right-handed parallel beta-helix repeat-containing protein, partial [Candidatus Heimdallarchaeota archaeon]
IIIVLSSLALILYFNLDFNFNRISPLTTFDRIEITKDTDFKEKYNFPGSGTEANPYMIKDYVFNTTDGIGISIIGTSKYFIIRNCTLVNNMNGIAIESVISSTADILDCIFIDNGVGLLITESYFVDVYNGLFEGNTLGLRSSLSNYLNLSSLYFDENNELPVFVTECNSGILTASILEEGITAQFYDCINWTYYDNLDLAMNVVNGRSFNFHDNIFASNASIVFDCISLYMDNNFFNGGLNTVDIRDITSNSITNNIISNGGFRFNYDIGTYISTLIFENNYVNSKPVVAFSNQNEVIIDNSTFGQIFCFNCTNVNINSGSYTNSFSPINCYGCKNVTLANNTISLSHDGSFGLYTKYCSEILTINNTITNCSYGTNFQFTDNVTIKENRFSNNGRGIYVGVYYHELKIQNNNCTNNEYGIDISDDGNAYSCKIENNRCNYNIQAGITIVNVDYILITNNIILDNNVNGLSISADHCNITGNEIRDSNLHGIDLDGSNTCFIFENDISGCQRGIDIENSAYITIFHNNIASCQSYGVQCLDTANNNKIYLNNFVDNCIAYPSQHQGNDNGFRNNFYDVFNSRGNYWSDWLGVGTYYINGGSNSIDLFPEGAMISW